MFDGAMTEVTHIHIVFRSIIFLPACFAATRRCACNVFVYMCVYAVCVHNSLKHYVLCHFNFEAF